jgi:predicted GNAT superfamily acetyltransferase
MQIPITIVRLDNIRDFRHCELLQQSIWGAEPVEVTPADLLMTIHRHGGLVLGALDEKRRMVGFVFGFPGITAADNSSAGEAGQLHHCSHALGVVPGWQGKGVGYQLKLAQRQWLKSQGTDLVTWTYDPLEAANAILNIGKLGAVCSCYLRDLYGTMPDRLNAGMASDRFEVAWWINSERVNRRVQNGWHPRILDDLLRNGIPVVNGGAQRDEGLIAPGNFTEPMAGQVLVEFPSNLQAIKQQDAALAVSWRRASREVFESLFSRGYAIGDVITGPGPAPSRIYYLLDRSTAPLE